MLIHIAIACVCVSCCSSQIHVKTAVLESVIRHSVNNQQPTLDIPHLAVQVGLSDLASFIYRADLTTTLSSRGPFTVFGPSNLAWFQLPPADRKELFLNNTLLRELLEYHVTLGAVYRNELKNEELLPSLLPGYNIRINLYKNNTIVTASGATIFKFDQNATNGVIHDLQSVMLPPPGTITYLVQTMSAFTTLLKAVSIAHLADTLNGVGPYTLFAPSDIAFSKIPTSELNALLQDPDLLTDILLHHMLNYTMYTAGLSNNDKLPTMDHQSLSINVNPGGVSVDDARVIMADVTVTNGVVHVIDTVLLPRGKWRKKVSRKRMY